MNKKIVSVCVGLLGMACAGTVLARDEGPEADTGRVMSQEEVRTVLEQRGWSVHTDAQGNLVLQPTAPGQEGTSGDDLSRLGALLGERGWRTSRDEQGNLLLFPPEPSSQAQVEPTPLPATENRLEDLKNALDARGWRTEWDQAGNLVLIPPGQAVRGQGGEDRGGDERIQATDTQTLEQRLRQRGWTVERDAEGALLVRPPAPAAAPGASATGQGCQFVTPEALHQGGIHLPVDQWQEAHDLANAWISRFGGEGLTVGKIRHINQIYLVSIVEPSQPFKLRNQLAIRVADGAVIALLGTGTGA